MLRALGNYLSAMAIAGTVVYLVLIYHHLSYAPTLRQPDRTAELRVLQRTVYLDAGENDELHILFYAILSCGLAGILLRRLSRRLED